MARPQEEENLPVLPIEHLPPDAVIPVEVKAIEPALEELWDREIDEELRDLPPAHIRFVGEWVKNGMLRPHEAYQKAINPEASKEIAAIAARKILRHKGVRMLIERLRDVATEDFFAVRATLLEALEAKDEIWIRGPVGPVSAGSAPNWSARIRASEVMAKLHGLNAPERHEVKSEHRSIVIEVQIPPLKTLDG